MGLLGSSRFLLRSDRSIWCSVAPVAAWRLDVGKGCQVEIDDRFERLRCGAAFEAVWQRGEPVGIVGLQGKQRFDRITPTLRTGATIRRAVRPGDGLGCGRLMADAVAGLALGVGQRVLALGFGASRHDCVLRYSNACSGISIHQASLFRSPI